jgi:aspartyl-tRNA(Asn)/glutamyl-tRNA(Gln) amidotransferase subunit B
MNDKIVVGPEIHDQPLPGSKMFSNCSANYAGAPLNTHFCLGCLGMPSTLPVINEKVVKLTVMTDLALKCTIPEYTKFGRENYFYPDVMKSYQITRCGS